MINTDYLLEISDPNSGGYCDFLLIKNHTDLGFKSFKRKDKADIAWKNQVLLSKFDLAPMPITSVCKLKYSHDDPLSVFLSPDSLVSSWGFVTEKADLIQCQDDSKIPFRKIQKLVNSIYQKTKLKFWDCHENNIGYIKRGRKKKMVCIDTGKESFNSYSNAWGFEEPGPKCPYCFKYQCRCL